MQKMVMENGVLSKTAIFRSIKLNKPSFKPANKQTQDYFSIFP
jgi:hypothetical protein